MGRRQRVLLYVYLLFLTAQRVAVAFVSDFELCIWSKEHLLLLFHQSSASLPISLATEYLLEVVVVELLSCVQLFVTQWTVALWAPLSSRLPWHLLKFMSVESVMLSIHFILC